MQVAYLELEPCGKLSKLSSIVKEILKACEKMFTHAASENCIFNKQKLIGQSIRWWIKAVLQKYQTQKRCTAYFQRLDHSPFPLCLTPSAKTQLAMEYSALF